MRRTTRLARFHLSGQLLPLPSLDVRAIRRRSMHSKRSTDQLANQQFHKDCSAEYLKILPTISQKCSDEDKNCKRRVESPYKQNGISSNHH